MLTDVESESEAAEVFLTSSQSPPSLTGGLTATDSFSAQLSPPLHQLHQPAGNQEQLRVVLLDTLH